jgi:hypothetical protein
VGTVSGSGGSGFVAQSLERPVSKKGTDAETNAVIYEGATIRQLGLMFKMDPKVVTRRCSGLIPVGRREGASVYSIPEAASRLVKPGYEIERYIMEMNHLDLPPLLSKEFWNSQRARLAFEEANGDLWRTPDVVRLISELFNASRMVLLLLPDTVEREAGLSREQKAVVRRVVDGTILDGRDKLVKRFESYGMGPEFRDDDGGGPVAVVPDVEGPDDPDGGGTGVPQSKEDESQYNGL